MTSRNVAVRQRTVLLVTPDLTLRDRVSSCLTGLRWVVLVTSGGAEAMAHLAVSAPEAIIVDHWLPDLDATEFMEYAAALCPDTDLLHMDGNTVSPGVRSSRRNELLHALREAQGESLPKASRADASERGASQAPDSMSRASIGTNTVIATHSADSQQGAGEIPIGSPASAPAPAAMHLPWPDATAPLSTTPSVEPFPAEALDVRMHLPDLVGNSGAMVELSRLVRLVAPHAATVLIQGETGTGKELVAKAVHRLSPRAHKPFVVLNCAAIPEHLLEAELFGHTRGAFTGAVASRLGRIEAAHGGTLFLDEIGEMPLALQAKMLRFLESGEVQRVGDNEALRVDVRIVAATHQPLQANTDNRLFRLDLYHRLAVFPIEVTPLRDRREDIPMLVEHLLRMLAESAPRKTVSRDALVALHKYDWRGNVRELCHVLQRAAIMAGDAPVIAPEHLRMRGSTRGL